MSSFLNNLSLSRKFAAVGVTIIAGVLILAVVSYKAAADLRERTENVAFIADKTARGGKVTAAANSYIGALHTFILLDSGETDIETQQKEEHREEINNLYKTISDDAEWKRKHWKDPKLLAVVEARMEILDKLHKQFKDGKFSVDDDTENDLIDQITGPEAELEKISAKSFKTTETEVEHSEQSADDTYKRTRLLLLIIGSVISFGALAGVLLLSRMIVPRVQRLAEHADAWGEGDLSSRVQDSSADELGKLAKDMNTMADNLTAMVSNVQDGMQTISTSSHQILGAVSDQTASVSQQSAAITQTTSAVEEIRASAEQAASKAQDAEQRALSAQQMRQEASAAVEGIADGMGDVRDRVQQIAQQIAALAERTQQIGDITSTVNDLADQSNLLALNAAIEASRAGEHGKGFAVVADEVRNLAEQSKHATAQVETILQEITKATSAAVAAAEQGTKVVEREVENVVHVREINQRIGELNSSAAQEAQQIAASAAQQNAGMDQIAQAMKETESSTSQLNDSAEQTRQSAEHLAAIASQLQQSTSIYRI